MLGNYVMSKSIKELNINKQSNKQNKLVITLFVNTSSMNTDYNGNELVFPETYQGVVLKKNIKLNFFC